MLTRYSGLGGFLEQTIQLLHTQDFNDLRTHLSENWVESLNADNSDAFTCSVFAAILATLQTHLFAWKHRRLMNSLLCVLRTCSLHVWSPGYTTMTSIDAPQQVLASQLHATIVGSAASTILWRVMESVYSIEKWPLEVSQVE